MQFSKGKNNALSRKGGIEDLLDQSVVGDASGDGCLSEVFVRGQRGIGVGFDDKNFTLRC